MDRSKKLRERMKLSYVGEHGEAPWVLTEGSIHPEGVAGWDTIDDVPTVIRSQAPRRVPEPGVEGWTKKNEADYRNMIEAMEKAIKKSEGTPGLDLWKTPKELVDAESRAAALEVKSMGKIRKLLTDWEYTQIRRMATGWGPYSARHYMYYMFGWIESQEQKKMIQPNYRQADDWGWRAITQAIDTKTGLLAIKRRRFGWTWIAVWLILHEMIINGGNCFFTSRADADIHKFIDRIRLAFDKLPWFIRPGIKSDAMERQIYEPSIIVCDALGRVRSEMSNSFLRTAAPSNESGFTGSGTSIFLADEVGEIPNIFEVLSWGTPMLADDGGYYRAGSLIMFGTVGKMSKAGKQVKKLVDRPGTYKFRPILVKGYMGVKLDASGNDMKEQFLADLADDIESLESVGNDQDAIQLRQKYPMSWEDAFLASPGTAIWPSHIISVARDKAVEEEKNYVYGRFYEDKGQVLFKEETPNKHPKFTENGWIGYGQWVIKEFKDISADLYANPFAAGSDPIDFERDMYGESDVKYAQSDFTVSILRRYHLPEFPGKRHVAQYADRPRDFNTAYRQAYLALRYYGAKVNIETQKGGRFISYLRSQPGGDNLIAYGSGVLLGLSQQQVPGFANSPKWQALAISQNREWWEFYGADSRSTVRSCDEALGFLRENTDITIAELAAVMYDAELDAREARGMAKTKAAAETARVNPWAVINGRIVNTNFGKDKRDRQLI